MEHVPQPDLTKNRQLRIRSAAVCLPGGSSVSGLPETEDMLSASV